ncbi:hypothetical protein HDU85_001299 [Gaertneriomyces sp. JEL0708]|nr:hypothetical protein HDU85_001299 [Gaertneriomyces sp. JEL0708]
MSRVREAAAHALANMIFEDRAPQDAGAAPRQTRSNREKSAEKRASFANANSLSKSTALSWQKHFNSEATGTVPDTGDELSESSEGEEYNSLAESRPAEQPFRPVHDSGIIPPGYIDEYLFHEAVGPIDPKAFHYEVEYFKKQILRNQEMMRSSRVEERRREKEREHAKENDLQSSHEPEIPAEKQAMFSEGGQYAITADAHRTEHFVNCSDHEVDMSSADVVSGSDPVEETSDEVLPTTPGSTEGVACTSDTEGSVKDVGSPVEPTKGSSVSSKLRKRRSPGGDDPPSGTSRRQSHASGISQTAEGESSALHGRRKSRQALSPMNLLRRISTFRISMPTLFAGADGSPNILGAQPTPIAESPTPLCDKPKPTHVVIIVREVMEILPIAAATLVTSPDTKPDGMWETIKRSIRRSFSKASAHGSWSALANTSLPKAREGVELDTMGVHLSGESEPLDVHMPAIRAHCARRILRERIMGRLGEDGIDLFERGETSRGYMPYYGTNRCGDGQPLLNSTGDEGSKPSARTRVVSEVEEQIFAEHLIDNLRLLSDDFEAGRTEWDYRKISSDKNIVTSMKMLKMRENDDIIRQAIDLGHKFNRTYFNGEAYQYSWGRRYRVPDDLKDVAFVPSEHEPAPAGITNINAIVNGRDTPHISRNHLLEYLLLKKAFRKCWWEVLHERIDFAWLERKRVQAVAVPSRNTGYASTEINPDDTRHKGKEIMRELPGAELSVGQILGDDELNNESRKIDMPFTGERHSTTELNAGQAFQQDGLESSEAINGEESHIPVVVVDGMSSDISNPGVAPDGIPVTFLSPSGPSGVQDASNSSGSRFGSARAQEHDSKHLVVDVKLWVRKTWCIEFSHV